MSYSPFGGYPYQPMIQPQQMYQPTAQRTEVVRVNGENGARAMNLAPNSSALVLDESAPLVWFLQTDGAGYKTATAYKISPVQQDQQTDIRGLEARIAKLEEAINNVKSNSPANAE